MLIISTALLVGLIVFGVVVERRSRTPPVRVGQVAPSWTRPAANGGSVLLAEQRGHVVILAFVPSINYPACAE